MKKISNILKRIVVALFIALLTMSLMPGLSVRAQEDAANSASSEIRDITSIEPETTINTGRTGSLKVIHKIIGDDNNEKNAPAGVKSRVYFVASVDERGRYTIDSQFASYPIFAQNPDYFNNGFNYDEWRNCVSHPDEANVDADNWNTGDLEAYIKENGISAVAEGVSNDNGETVYSGLTLGIYFVESDDIIIGDFVHSFINFVYPVPILEKSETGGNLIINYNPVASPKKSKVGVDVHCGIRKQWDDSSSNNRPATVSFRVYVDGVEAEWSPITLSSENDWQYNWTDKGNPKYTVEEINNPEGYSSEITLKQVGPHDFIYTCVNHYSGDNPPPPPDNPPPDNPPPDNPPPTNPPSNPPGAPDLPGVLGAIRALPQVLGARRLPQTGQLWWPLPILVIAGIFFIVKGIKKNAKMKAQNN
ncbi:MAG: Cna B-type domain-containing protein [Eubacterium sp.]|nr:Cna B-type domain-containing protein [Eubacterium sp.]